MEKGDQTQAWEGHLQTDWCGVWERTALPTGSPRRGKAGTDYLSFVKVAYDDIIERLLQLPVGLGVLLTCLHDLRRTLLI